MNLIEFLRSKANVQTPYLLYSQDILNKTSDRLINALPEQSNLLYSVKANPNPAIFKFLKSKGIFFETASEGEFRHLINNGISAEQIVCSGQGKSLSYLKKVIEAGALAVNIESLNELNKLRELSAQLDITIDIMLRVNPLFDNKESALIMGGASTPFGIDEELIYEIFSSNIKINGLFMYAGSNYHNFEHIIRNTKYLFELAEKLYSSCSVKLKYLDFGGGFGVPESDNDPELDITEMNKKLKDLFIEKTGLECFSNIQKYFFESGRYLTAKSGLLITRVIDIKVSRGKKYAVLDGGINCLGIKQMEYRLTEPRIKHIKHNEHGKSSGNYENFCLVGSTCTTIDMSHNNIKLLDAEIGDFICFEDCGAYSLEFSPKNFCGQITPAEYIYNNDIFTKLRDYGNIDNPYEGIWINN